MFGKPFVNLAKSLTNLNDDTHDAPSEHADRLGLAAQNTVVPTGKSAAGKAIAVCMADRSSLVITQPLAAAPLPRSADTARAQTALQPRSMSAAAGPDALGGLRCPF